MPSLKLPLTLAIPTAWSPGAPRLGLSVDPIDPHNVPYWAKGTLLDPNGPVAIAPGTFYTPVSPLDASIVHGPAGAPARSLLAWSTAVKLNAAGVANLMTGNISAAQSAFYGAQVASLGIFGIGQSM